MSDTNWEMAHDARVRTCIVIAHGIPVSELRDDIRCPACDELHRLQHLDPDVLEVLVREPWCASCEAAPDAAPEPVADAPAPTPEPSPPVIRCPAGEEYIDADGDGSLETCVVIP